MKKVLKQPVTLLIFLRVLQIISDFITNSLKSIFFGASVAFGIPVISILLSLGTGGDLSKTINAIGNIFALLFMAEFCLLVMRVGFRQKTPILIFYKILFIIFGLYGTVVNNNLLVTKTATVSDAQVMAESLIAFASLAYLMWFLNKAFLKLYTSVVVGLVLDKRSLGLLKAKDSFGMTVFGKATDGVFITESLIKVVEQLIIKPKYQGIVFLESLQLKETMFAGGYGVRVDSEKHRPVEYIKNKVYDLQFSVLLKDWGIDILNLKNLSPYFDAVREKRIGVMGKREKPIYAQVDKRFDY